MKDFIEHVKEDGTIEYRNPDYDKLLAEAEEAKKVAMEQDFPELSEEEIAEGNLRALRRLRDQKLAETDWSQGEDVPTELKNKYKTYRQALRDITKTHSTWVDVNWPEKPE